MQSEKFKEKEPMENRKDIGLYPHYIYQYTDIIPNIIFDIGSWNGDDAERLRKWFDINDKNVYCIEPNPHNFSSLVSLHPNFNNFQIGISNFTGTGSFLCYNGAGDISSFVKMISRGEDDYEKISIDVFRMNDFIKKYNITEIDICKIDVEGKSYELLEGFGDKLNIVKSLQIEAELKPLYEGQKLFDDIKHTLISNQYTMVEYYDTLNPDQCDSLWIKNEYLKKT